MNNLIRLLILVVIVFAQPTIGWSQEKNKKNAFGIGLQIYPVKNTKKHNSGEKALEFGLNVKAEYERFLTPKNSISVRGEAIAYNYGDENTAYEIYGQGKGGGFGVSFKHFFLSNYKGLFAGPAIDFISISETYKRNLVGFGQTFTGERKSSIVLPNITVGYRANLGDAFSASGGVVFGYRSENIKEEEGEFEELPGQWVYGLTLEIAWRF